MSVRAPVKVAIRIRNMVEADHPRRGQRGIVRVANEPRVSCDKKISTFDYVFDENDSQSAIFEQCVSEMVTHIMDGYNATILAYGQTGCGKTYTMGTADYGNEYQDGLDDVAGVIPRAMHDLFQRIDAQNSTYEFSVKCSYMQLYREELSDLFSSGVLQILDGRDGVVIPQLTEIPVNSAREVIDLLVHGSASRMVGATEMNPYSSRSHAIFIVTVCKQRIGDEQHNIIPVKLHFVDLAGSESASKSSLTSADTRKEALDINKGLLALSKLINALSRPGSAYAKNRDSKLTRVLQDSLGGNSMALMIACVSPGMRNISETKHTLHYAESMRKIRYTPVPIVNVDPHTAEVNRLNDIINQLREENEELRAAATRPTADAEVNTDLDERVGLEESYRQARTNLAQKTEEVEALKQELAETRRNARIAEANRQVPWTQCDIL